ncbi:hypothetical protein ACSFA7_01560 [Variovorax sp. LT1R20]|uniref:hypothetical protein n=1 Tax=Variovorax sp. LT1R20 TaxID=3443729 RepID=UPI003F448230
MNFILRVLLLLLGLVFAASLAVAVMLLAAVWGVRYAWGRLTGKPVTPWVMRFNPRSGFDRFRNATQPAEPTAADVVSARARGESVRSPITLGRADDVTDVRARPVRGE